MKSLKNINFYAKIPNMKWFVLGLILVLTGTSTYALPSKTDKEPVVSTQGIEIDKKIEKSKPSPEQKNEQKEFKNRSKKYIRYNKNLKRENIKKEEKQKELDYLQKRLEIKKTKLEIKFPAEVKGEEK